MLMTIQRSMVRSRKKLATPSASERFLVDVDPALQTLILEMDGIAPGLPK